MKKIIITAVCTMIPAIALLVFVHPEWANVKADSVSNQQSAYSETFFTNLTGSNQVPPVSTNASGVATFNVSADGSSIDYTISTSNLQNITAAHLHCAASEQNGPAIVNLLGSTTPSSSDSAIGMSSTTWSGTITMADIMQPVAMSCNPNIQTLTHLVQAMREGKIYVNVHTVANPMGEIRGQLMQGTPTISPISTSTSATTTLPAPVTVTPDQTINSSGSTTASTTMSTTSQTSPVGTYYVLVTPDSYFKIQGGTVMFTGSHFYPGETVTISTGGSVIGTTQADYAGNLTTGSFTVPNARGRQVYTFTGSVSSAPFSVGISVGGAYPWLNLSSYYAGAGTQIAITGHGFGSNEPVTVWFAGTNVGTVGSDANGDFSMTATVPTGGAGTRVIQAIGANTGASVQATFSQAY